VENVIVLISPASDADNRRLLAELHGRIEQLSAERRYYSDPSRPIKLQSEPFTLLS